MVVMSTDFSVVFLVRSSFNQCRLFYDMNRDCRVCGDSNGQHHYGTICCPSCKGFFRRIYISNKNIECSRGNSCVINKATRNICRSCRYKKCLQVGMNVKEIRGKMEKRLNESAASQSNSTSSPSSSNSSSLPQSITNRADLGYSEALDLAQIYNNLEKFCECNFIESTMTREEEDNLISRMLNCNISELIRKTSPQCPRFKRIWKPHEMLDDENFVRSWSRSIVNFLDFASRIPAFNQLSLHDQKCWFANRFAACTFLTMAYYTRLELCEGLLFGCSNVFPLKDEISNNVEDKHLKDLFQPITKTLFTFVIYPIINLKLSAVQFSLLKAVVFFSQGISTTSMTNNGVEMMIKEYDKHKKALNKLLFNDVDGYFEQSDILFQLEDLLSSIERCALHFNHEMQYFNFLQLPIAKKNLFVECHVDTGFKMDNE